MICDPCKAGDHCGPPGEASAHCPCQHRKPSAPLSAPSGGPGDQEHPPGPPSRPEGRAARLADVLRDVPTVSLLSAWQHFHLRRDYAPATHLRRVVTDRLIRLDRTVTEEAT